jgi:hypothetical protein
MAPPEVTKKAVKQAMVDLHTIHREFKDRTTMPPRPKQIANQNMVGIIYNNQMGGRNQQWEQMTMEECKKGLDVGKGFVESDNFKTKKVYGTMGIDISPGTETALRLYFSLPGKRTHLALEPALPKTKNVAVAKNLQLWHRRKLGDYTAMTTTLFRKNLHTAVADPQAQEKCMELLCRVDTHRVSTGKAHYVVSNPQKDAETSRLILNANVIGPWKHFKWMIQKCFNSNIKWHADNYSFVVANVRMKSEHCMLLDTFHRQRFYLM